MKKVVFKLHFIEKNNNYFQYNIGSFRTVFFQIVTLVINWTGYMRPNIDDDIVNGQ